MTKILNAPVRGAVPPGGYVIISEPVSTGSSLSTFAKVPGSAIGGGSGSADLSNALLNDRAADGSGGDSATGDHSYATVTSPAVSSIKPTLLDLTSAFKPFDFFGGKASNADNLTALNNWVAYGGPVLIPAGQFIVSGSPNTLTNKTTAIVGLGDGVSVFVFAAGANGLSFAQNSYNNPTHLRDFSLWTQSTNDLGTALSYVEATSDVIYRFQHRLSIQRVGIRGTTVQAAGWAKGISLTDPQVALLDTVTVTGRNDSTIPAEQTRAGVGHMVSAVEITGTPEICTDIDIRHLRANNCQTGLAVRGHVEGIRVDGGLLANVWRGIDIQLSSARPGFNINGTHVNGFDYGVFLSSVYQAKVTNCLIYKHPWAAAAMTAVALSGGCTMVDVENNQAVNQTADFGTAGAWRLATVTDCDNILIRNNEVERPSVVTSFTGNTTNSRVWNNYPFGALSGATFVQHADTSGTGSNTSDQVNCTDLNITSTDPTVVHSLMLTNTNAPTGVGIRMTGNGATTPDKYIRSHSGAFEIVNSDYSAVILGLNDAGLLSIKGGASVAGGNLTVTAGTIKASSGLGAFNTTPPSSKPTVTGSRGGNAALASLLTALAATGLIEDGTSA